MRTILGVLALCSMSASSLAAEYGIGASAKSEDAWIYVPIDISTSFRIEPAIRYVSGESENSYEYEDSFLLPDSETIRSESDQLELSVGLFRLSTVKEATRLYYGVRFAYVDGEGETVSTAVFDEIPDGEVVSMNEQTFDGYRVAPTFGFEYSFNEHFSLGAEVAWFYLEMDGTSSSRTISDGQEVVAGVSRTGFDQERTGTDTHVIVRYRF